MRFTALLILAATFVPRDLDVPIPPGTPLDWIRHHPKPVPTGTGGRTPTPYRQPGAPAPGGGTRAEEIEVDRANHPHDPVYLVLNAQELFRGISRDATGHLKWGTCPPCKPIEPESFEIEWHYPPEFPAELVWAGLACELRAKLHPTGISWAEAAAYCMEVGEPTLRGAEIGDGTIKVYLKAELGRDLPAKKPEFPRVKDPKEAVLARLAAVELSGGFPHALDPAYARRTRALGADAYNAVVECTRSPHVFLARNAVAQLAAYDKPEATKELLRLWRDTRDPVMRFRILRALADRKETSIVNELTIMLDGSDLPWVVAVLHALGRIGDPIAMEPIQRLLMAQKAKQIRPESVDLNNVIPLWTALPALGHLGKGAEFLIGLERRLLTVISGDDQTPADDPHPRKVFRQMCVVSLAWLGEKRYVDEMIARVEKSGLGGFHIATAYQLVGALALTDRGAAALKAKVFGTALYTPAIRLEALEALLRNGRIQSPELKEIALNEKEPVAVRGRALQGMAAIDTITAKAVCRDLLVAYSRGELGLDPEMGYLLSVAARVGGELRAHDGAVLLKCVEKAFAARMVAQRLGNNSTNLASMIIEVHPAMLETMVIELGRTGFADAVPTLVNIINKRSYPQGRAESALALGSMTGPDVKETLVDALDDKDGWVRFCAYRALVRISKQDHFCDWIFGDATHRKPAREAYEKWLKGK